jgi:methyl-accepting chemotaxis protein
MSKFFRARLTGAASILAALEESFGVIEFEPDGTIIRANKRFLDAVGYSLPEIVRQHHKMFLKPEDVASSSYAAFWQKLGRGEFDTGEYRRVTKAGREVWLQASYTPVKGAGGKVRKVVKLALDITAAKRKSLEDNGLLEAINRSQAVIEFSLDGTILNANENFLATMGYAKSEVTGAKHAMFVEPTYAASAEYRDFWARLRRGEFFSGEFRRLGKGGREIWLQASYNPVFDEHGQVVRVVKFAFDLAERMRCMRLIADGVSHMAQGKLAGVEIEAAVLPLIDQLRLDFNAAAGILCEAMAAIAQAATVINENAGAVDDSTAQLADRLERQAASLEETAAALDEITATVRKTADGAGEVSRVVGNAKSDTQASEIVVSQAVTAMGEIDGSSTQISQIIGVIDEIAFQTNLLALNAGVEAARAGDAGRGFAVVATEVRALAQRSSDAAKQIKTLITESSQHVAEGVKAVDGARTALDRIATHVTGINTAIGEIAASAREQSEGLGQVNGAVNQMDQMTQQSAAMVEEAAAASQNLAREIEGVMSLLSKFDTGASSLGRAVATRQGNKPSLQALFPGVHAAE